MLATAMVAQGLAVMPASASILEIVREVVAPAELPALVSTPAPVLEPEVPAGEFTPRPPRRTGSEGSSFDPERSVPVDGSVTATEIVYDNPDGTRTAEVSLVPVRVRQADGSWRAVDLTLEPGEDGRLRARVAPPGWPTLPADASGDVVMPTSAGPILLRHPGARPSRASSEGRQARYPDALGAGVSLVQELVPGGFEESVVLADASGPSHYDDHFLLPAGATARQGDTGVEFLDATGVVVARFGSGVAFDSASPTRGVAPVATTLVSVEGSKAVVRVSVDRAWLRASARVFPVTIDPIGDETFTGQPTGYSTINSSAASTWQGTMTIGTADGGATVARALMKFKLPGEVGTSAGNWPLKLDVLEAHVQANYYSGSTNPTSAEVYGLAGVFDRFTTWSDQPSTDAFAPIPSVSTGTKLQLDTTELVRRWLWDRQRNFGLEIRAQDETDNAQYERFYSPVLSVTYTATDRPAKPMEDAPATGAVLHTTLPTLSSSVDASDDTGRVRFTIATEPDAESGTVIDSGWLAQPSKSLGVQWSPPTGAMQDGRTYYWHAWGGVGGPSDVPPDWVRSFTVDLRLGAQKTAPIDSYGPVSVNLASGNLVVEAGSSTRPSVGGPIGVSFTYNSLGDRPSGLFADYYRTSSTVIDDTKEAEFRRIEPLVDADWGLARPSQQLGYDHFRVRWTGYVTVPVTGSYEFGATGDDGMRVTVDGTVVLDEWQNQTLTTPTYDGSVLLVAGTAVPIRVDYYENVGEANVALWVRGAVPESKVPGSWLSPTPPTGSPTVGGLPNGWRASADLSGAFASAEVTDRSVVLVEHSGVTHTYTALPDGGYVPPPDEHGVISFDVDGNLVFDDGVGVIYTFGPSGELVSAVSGLDVGQPAAPTFSWSGTPTRLSTITDPVSNRTATLRYGGDAACPLPAPTGFDVTAPDDVLCSVTNVDGSETRLWYVDGQLARIESPGNAAGGVDGMPVTDFAYTNGRLTSIRTSLAADAVAAGVRADDATARTEITYDGDGKVASVTLPAPTAGAARPAHTYSYYLVYGVPTAEIDVVGLVQPSGYFRKVTYDAAGQVLSDTLAGAGTTTYSWAGSQPVNVVAPGNRKTSHVYDMAGRVTDVYGPSSALPGPSVPRQMTAYDEGLKGLAATYWDTTDLTGQPFAHDTGVGEASGQLNRDWGTGVPAAGLTPGDWSGRYTGWINVGGLTSGDIGFRALRTGSVRIWIDDTLVVDAWTDAATATLTPTRAYNHVPNGNNLRRIRVEYKPTPSGAAQLELRWKPVSGAEATVPGVKLTPNYGLVTTTTREDLTAGSPSHVTRTVYANPAIGLPTQSIIDPSGLALTSSIAYESAGAGHFLRPISSTLPAGNMSSSTYYGVDGNPATADNPCGPETGIDQAGALWKRTSPDPDGSGPELARVEESVYDAAGRVLAGRVNNDEWTCFTFDQRGRLLTTSIPAGGAEPARTITHNYAVGGNPLVTSVTDPAGTITTTVDLLGRVTATTDVWNKTTVSTYDQAGRLIESIGPAGVRTTEYDVAGRPTRQKLDGLTVADARYTSTEGDLERVTYPDGVGNAGTGFETDYDYDSSGRLRGIEHKLDDTYAINTVIYSQSGRVVGDTTAGAANHTGLDYVYDAAGRLTTAYVPGHTLTYGYAASNGCGYATAGKNTNRTSLVDNGVTTSYCYDQADRLTSTTDARYGSIAYDTHGNTTALGGQELGYDGADRHISTDIGDTNIRYTRDATDRIVQRQTTSVGIGFKAAATAAAKDVTSLSVSPPAGTAAGDLLIAQIANNNDSGSVLTAPSGWTMISTVANGTRTRQTVYWRVATSSEPATYQWTAANARSLALAVASYTGVDTSNPIDAHASAASLTGPSVTTSTPQALLLQLVANEKNEGVTPAVSMTEQWEKLGPSATSIEAASEQLGAAGSTGPRTATGNVISPVSHMIALRASTTPTVRTTRYSFAASGDSASAVLDEAGAVVERTIALIGGVMITKRGAGDVWSYPNVHGDIMITSDGAGVPSGPTRLYDPYGQALAGLPDNGADNYDYGWLGQHQRGLEQEAGSDIIEMGARAYVPGLGRFLQVDPVEGGSANSYDYVNGDPINAMDLAGLCNEATVACITGILKGTESLPGEFWRWAKKKYGSYTVITRGNRRMKGAGDCSSPTGNTGRSFNFTQACQTHDLGYDLLRYFGTTGKRGHLRRAVDALFGQDLRSHCAGRSIFLKPTCYLWADTYESAVDGNSALWLYGVPK